MRGKKGTAADHFMDIVVWFFVLFLFLFVTQCMQPTLTGKNDFEITVLLEDENDNVFVLGLLQVSVGNKPVSEWLSYAPAKSGDRVKEIHETLQKALRESAEGPSQFRLYLDDVLLTEDCFAKCPPSKKYVDAAFVLPERNGGALSYRLEVYSP